MREDLYAHARIIENNLVHRLGYRQWIVLCAQFIESQVIALDGNLENSRVDLSHALNFLEGRLSEEQLISRQTSAWSRHKKSRKEGKDLEERVQRLTVIFLYPDFLHGIEKDEMPDSHEFLFLHLIYKIRPTLCNEFLEWVEAHAH